MRSILSLSLEALLFLSATSLSQTFQDGYNSAPKFYGSMMLGYNGGFGSQLNFSIGGFRSGLPINLRFGLGYTSVEPGIPDSARKIFINNATNGTPEENGYSWDLRFDLLIAVNVLSKSFVYLGPRYSMFTANFKYVGGNEFFDITSNQFGLGGGFKTHFRWVQIYF